MDEELDGLRSFFTLNFGKNGKHNALLLGSTRR